jgi:phosphate transport system permease protein
MANVSEEVPNPVNIDLDITNKKGENLSIDDGFIWLVRSFAFLTVALLFWISWVIFDKARKCDRQIWIRIFLGQRLGSSQ